jgi:hypothetical protein
MWTVKLLTGVGDWWREDCAAGGYVEPGNMSVWLWEVPSKGGKPTSLLSRKKGGDTSHEVALY